MQPYMYYLDIHNYNFNIYILTYLFIFFFFFRKSYCEPVIVRTVLWKIGYS